MTNLTNPESASDFESARRIALRISGLYAIPAK